MQIELLTLEGGSAITDNIAVTLGIGDGPGLLLENELISRDGSVSASIIASAMGTISFWVHAPGGERRNLELQVGRGEIHPADFTGDGRVDFVDFLEFIDAFGAVSGSPEYESRFDLTADGKIDFNDFLDFAAAFGT